MFQVKKKYAAEIIDAGLTKSKAGNEQVFVTLNVKADDGSIHKNTWYGSMVETQVEKTIGQLVKMGFMGNSFDDLNKGHMMFDGTLPRTVEFGFQQTKNEATGLWVNTDKLKVKWVNVKSRGIEKLEKSSLTSQAALFQKVKSELGLKTQPKTAVAKNEGW